VVAAAIGLDEGAQENARASIAVPLKLLHVRVELNAPPLRRCLAQAGKAKACMCTYSGRRRVSTANRAMLLEENGRKSAHLK